jgi:hypothetical protein
MRISRIPPGRLPCRHCHARQVGRPRGLCWDCFFTPGVRELYPPTDKSSRRGVGNVRGAAPLPAEPTSTLPGTEEKVRVLEQRAARGEELWHPLDSRDAPDLPAELQEVA